ncbi:APC family permease [Rothia sp. SD9660Na]|uniref:APC family permease n=1 Tax=Rothia sp. SD9660Na TaxID=3047030 RepID=UPI0024BAA0FE|nr:APC family permease [Rothia sp. SD9660Na]WHS50804.1 APC family permease [Rothia sp. SD9660Na]
MATHPQAKLSLTDAVYIGVGSMIGAGLFAAFAPATAAAGNWLLLSLALAAFLAFANATSSAQLAAQYPESGGTYIYGNRQLGHIWGFAAGWCFVIGKTASCAAMALTFAAYLAPGYEKPLAIAAVAALTTVNYRGITRTAALTKILVTVVLLALAVFFGAVLLGVAPEPSLATMGAEVRDPARTIPRAIIIALTLVGSLYVLVALALIHQLGYEGLADASAPLAAAVGSSAPLAALMGLAASIGALGALLALITGIGRTGQAMASNRDLPTYFAHLHPVYAVPYRLEITVAVAVTALILLFDVRGAIGFSSFGVLLYYCVANLAAFTQTAPYRRYPRTLQVAGAVGCCLVVGTLPPASIAGGLVLLGVGLAVYLLYDRPTQTEKP